MKSSFESGHHFPINEIKHKVKTAIEQGLHEDIYKQDADQKPPQT
jgi:hypothetical protein